MQAYGCVGITVHMWRSENNLRELVLSYDMGPGDKTQVIKLGNRCLYLLHHLDGLGISFVIL